MKLSNKKLFLLDMDGTLYLDGQLFEGTLPFLAKVREKGGRCLYLTNNSSKNANKYIKKLADMGISARRDDFVTSVEATVAYLLAHHPGALLYVCGTRSLKAELRKNGFPIAKSPEEPVEALVCGFDTELTFKKLDDCAKLLTLRPDLPYIATNPDWVCPTSYGYVPDCGSVCEMLFRATGRRPVVIGKPQRYMVDIALYKTGCKPEEALLVGDRLYTDIACAINAGIDGAFVLSGEGTLEDIEKMKVLPTFIYRDIGELAKDL